MTSKFVKKSDEQTEIIADLTNDLQRTRADFENYRRRVENDLAAAKTAGEQKTISRILPILDDVDRAIANVPNELRETDFAKGLVSIAKNLTKLESDLGLAKIDAAPGTDFNPDFHHAVAIDESEGNREVVVEELQNGWILNGAILRSAMVRVARQ